MLSSEPGNLPGIGTGIFPDHEDLVVPSVSEKRSDKAEADFLTFCANHILV